MQRMLHSKIPMGILLRFSFVSVPAEALPPRYRSRDRRRTRFCGADRCNPTDLLLLAYHNVPYAFCQSFPGAFGKLFVYYHKIHPLTFFPFLSILPVCVFPRIVLHFLHLCVFSLLTCRICAVQRIALSFYISHISSTVQKRRRAARRRRTALLLLSHSIS